RNPSFLLSSICSKNLLILVPFECWLIAEESVKVPMVCGVCGSRALATMIGYLTLLIPTCLISNKKSFLLFCISAISDFLVGFVRGPGSTEPNNLCLSALFGNFLNTGEFILFIRLSFNCDSTIQIISNNCNVFNLYTHIQVILGSVLFFLRLILSLFQINTNIVKARIIKNNNNCIINLVIIVATTPVTIDAKETYFERYKLIKNVSMTARNRNGCTPRIIPPE